MTQSTDPSTTTEDAIELWTMAAIAFLVFSSITTSLDPGYRGQITGLATFAKFIGMGVGPLLFERVMHISFSTALIAFAMFQILVGFAAIYAFRGEYRAVPVDLEQNPRT